MNHILRVRRALLYMPGDSRRKIDKAVTLDVDCICMDLEDGVAPSHKAAARAAVLAALQELNFGRSERLVRINPPGSGLENDDLSAVLPGRPDGIVLPKVHDAGAVLWLDEQLAAAEQHRGWPSGSVSTIAIVESARGIVNLREICGAASRLSAIIFGAEDLAGDMGVNRTPEGTEVFYARSAVVTYAAAFGLQAIDMVSVDFRDQARLEREAAEGARLGYAGKQAIHPNQVGPIQAAFTPTLDAIAQACRIVAAAKAHAASGTGAFALDDKMIDAPVVKSAEAILAKARAAGVEC